MNKLKILSNFAKVLFVSLFFLTYSCTLNCCTKPFNDYTTFSIRQQLPRESFVKIEKTTNIQICETNVKKLTQCDIKRVGSSASGFIIKNDEEGSYVVTAAHVCDDTELKAFMHKSKDAEIIEKKFELLDIDKIRYNFIALKYDRDIDVCVGYSYSMAKPPVILANAAPAAGDVTYNLAAPIGIFDENSIPILHGNFIGVSKGRALYTVPAAGGSSGSPLLNSDGELIGLIHSVYVRFPFISISPTYKQLINFINTNSNKELFMIENPHTWHLYSYIGIIH